MPDTYILQKDLPNSKAGNKYHLTECGNDYVCHSATPGTWDVSFPKEYVQNNPEWFKKEAPLFDAAAINKRMDELKQIPIMIVGINQLLSSLSKIIDAPILYTETDMLNARKETFEAARLRNSFVGFKFYDFEDYLINQFNNE
jgi:hypothetical protein